MPKPVKIKMCGMTIPEDAEVAAKLGAEAIGMILSEKDKEKTFVRYVSKHQAMDIVSALPDQIKKVGVFVNEDPDRINSLVEILQLDFVQLHGEETPDDMKKVHCDIIKAIKVTGSDSLNKLEMFKAQAFLFDAAEGGSGEAFDWSWLKDVKAIVPIILAGGLNQENVAEAISRVSPDWVDVSSGIEGETAGRKDPGKMKRFIDAVNNAR